jgi:hypothetical protein
MSRRQDLTDKPATTRGGGVGAAARLEHPSPDFSVT